MKRIIFGVLMSLIAFSGCKEKSIETGFGKKQNHSIKGQVFVIQKNRLNVKLGGVDVYYIPIVEFRKRCGWINAQRARAIEVKSYKETMNRIDDWLTDVGVARSAPKLRTFLDDASHLQSSARSRYDSNPEILEFERIENLRKSNIDLFESSEISSNETCQWIATCLYFDWIDRNSDRSTKTDADGNFSLTITKSSPGVIMMNSSRQLVGGGFENFYWLKEIAGDEIDPIIFSSKDTVNGGFLMEIVRQASEPNRSSQKVIQNEMNLVDLEWFSNAQPIFNSISGADKQIQTLELGIKDMERSIQDVRYSSER